MSRYVITITDDDSTTAAAAATTVRIDTSSGQTRVTELTVRAADSGGLAPGDLPPVDLDLLVRALAAPGPALPPAADTHAPAPIETTSPPAAEHTVDAEQETTTSPDPQTDQEPTANSGRRSPGRKTASRARAGRGGTAAKATTSTKRSTGKTAGHSTTGTQRSRDTSRPYRRMPDATEVIAAYQQVGTVSGLAEHYDVPRHTANSWVRTLRRQGHTIDK